jgi:RNA-directed DNA polymerase
MDKGILQKWLKAGFLEKNVLYATTEGTPQGGIISPALANWALDGLEEWLARHYGDVNHPSRRHKVHLVRYADDFIITGTSKVFLTYGVKPLVEHFLAERGLELSHEKTRITRLDDGFDFLGQTIRRYGNGKVLAKPSKKSVQTFLAGIQEVITKEGGHCTAGDLIRTLNSKIKGWTMYHRHVCSKRIFHYVDHRIFWMLWRWCQRRHPKKAAKWIKETYFQRIETRDWVFTGIIRTKKGKGYPIVLMKASKVKIQRHVQIRGAANPYDPEWEEYFEERITRRMQQTLAGREQLRSLWIRQGGRCDGCGQLMQEDEEWQIHHRVWRTLGGSDEMENLELLHGNCHRQRHSRMSKDKADCVLREAFEEA